MALSLTVTPNKTFSGGNPGEKVTYSDLNLLGAPTVSLTGEASASQLGTDSVTSAKIQDGAVTTDKLADNSVNNSKLADGTAGSIRSYDVSGNPSDIAPGTSGYILQSNGAGNLPTWVPVNTTVSNVDIGQINGDPTDGSLVTYGGAVYRHKSFFEGSEISITGGNHNEAHGLTAPDGSSAVPLAKWVIVNKTPEHGFTVGDEIPIEFVTFSASVVLWTATVWADATDVNVSIKSGVSGMTVGLSGTGTTLTLSNWRLKPYAYLPV